MRPPVDSALTRLQRMAYLKVVTSDSSSVVALRSAVKRAGSQSAFARLIGVTPQAVQKWVARKRELPPTYVLAAEAGTGISRYDLRPDVYGQAPEVLDQHNSSASECAQ